MSRLHRICRRYLTTAVVSVVLSSSALAQTKAYVGNFKDNTVSIVDADRGRVVATLPVGPGPHGMAVSLDGRRVFVGADAGSTITVIDTVGDHVVAEIDVGKSPHGFALQPDGRALLVGVYGEDRVAWIDVATSQVLHSVGVAKPHTIAIHPDGRVAYVASQQPGQFALVVVDVERHAVLRRIALDKPPRDLEFGAAGPFLFFTVAGDDAVQVLDSRTDRIVDTIKTGASPHVAKVVDGSNQGLVVVQGKGELMRFDASNFRPGAAIRVGSQPHWMSIYDQGRSVAVTNEGSDTLSLVDLSSDAVRSVDVGRGPRKVVTVRSLPAVSSAPSGAAIVEKTVAIRNFAFQPATQTIAAGGTIVWRNDDGSPHAIALDDRPGGGDVLLPGQAHAEAFLVPGQFAYHCETHPFMTGRIVVEPR